ncbi:hypothetical protein [Ralstonia chuxiongensis]|uniref:hypothetical protein n=1 Tax=Ralstonia chuxiongensis TaxID=2957504 RepID=UPI0028F6A710|nr:hypothetical protein [Ralstonia chuxiongensis]CAJ0771634.1 hypothetical protein R8510_01811 [Ralstonia chuxiongensis]
MTATTPASEPERLTLCPGQAGLRWLLAGTTLVALEGSLCLEPPSRSIAASQYTLGAGHAHVVETSGWWHLHADRRSGAHVHIVAAVAGTRRPAWPAIWRWLANVIQPRQTSRG